MQISFLKHFFIAFFLVSTFAHGQVPVAQLSPSEIEKRNAAAAFAKSREASLSILIGECGHLMSNSNVSMEVIAKGWIERNKPELEASLVWIDKYMAHLKSTDEPAWQRVSQEFARALGTSIQQSARVFFARKMPDLASCEKAANTFSITQLDFKNIAKNQGYEQFSEFPETLIRIRNESGFIIPSHLKFGYEVINKHQNGLSNIASLDAAYAARERGDGPGRMAAYKSMAIRGDGVAAQTVGLMLLNGQQIEKNYAEAYRWFYAAWSLAEMEGLNALGVMLKDGLSVPVNPILAQTAFYLAKAGARKKDALDRAEGNLNQLANQITSVDKSKIACTTLNELDAALLAPIRTLPAVTPVKKITGPERRLGSIVKDLAAFYQPDSCR